MDQKQLKAGVADVLDQAAEMLAAGKKPDDQKIARMALFGITLVGELFLDIKRIADASEREPDIAKRIERVARHMAAKEALRKLGGPQVTDGPGDRADNERARQAWVNENWPAFQTEAAELLAAVSETK